MGDSYIVIDRPLKILLLVLALLFILMFSLPALRAESKAETEDYRIDPKTGEITSHVAAGEFDADLNYAQVLQASALPLRDNTWRFTARLEHRDEILPNKHQHYADRYQIIDPSDGSILAERILYHHHIGEMPFSRSTSVIEIPEELEAVIVRAACTDHGFMGRQVLLPLIRN